MHDNMTAKDKIYAYNIIEGASRMWGPRQDRLSSEPPYDDKKPKNEDEKDDIPQPTTPLTVSHNVHAPECASENA